MSNNFKQKLIEYAHQTEEKIRYIRELQMKLSKIKDTESKEFKELNNKLINKIDELW